MFRKFTYVLNFNVYFHHAIGREWDAIHLYITNNIEWMKVWIKKSEQLSHGISWEGVASLVKAAHRNGDRNLTERESRFSIWFKIKWQAY